MNKKQNDKQILEGRWYSLPKRGIRVVCCDCGAEHTAEFRWFKDKLKYRAFKEVKPTIDKICGLLRQIGTIKNDKEMKKVINIINNLKS